jgi:hypothetical protein
VLGEEVDERGNGVETESIIGEIYGVQFGQREEGIYEV